MADEDDLTTDATPIEEAAPAAGAPRRRGSTRRLTLFMSVFVLGALTIAFFLLTGGNEPETSRLPSGRGDIRTTPGGPRQASSPEYRENLAQANREGFESAVERGASFIPTPEAIPSDVALSDPTTPRPFERPPEPEAPPQTGAALPAPIVLPPPEAPAPPQAAPAAPASPQPAEAPAPDPTLYVEYLATIVKRIEPRASGTAGPTADPPQQQPGQQPPTVPVGARPAPGTAGTAAPGTAPVQQPPPQELETLIQAGDILYAETINASTSDLPTPVLATVVTGQFRDSRLVGAFTVPRNADGMVVQFSTITFPDGRTAPVNAYAIDPTTASSAVSSDIDRRWLDRFGPIVAAGFVAGFAESAAISTGTVTESSDGTTRTISETERTTRQNVAAGLAEAGQGISQVIRDSAPVGPEILLASGTGVAVLFVNPVSLPKQQAEDDPS